MKGSEKTAHEGKAEARRGPGLALAFGPCEADPAPDQTPDPTRDPALRAFSMMQAQAEEMVSIAELAARSGIGIRSLQIAFARRFGAPPREMLTLLRLERARARLLAPPPGARVTAIALEAGFTHLSRFAEAYRALYGERPVETLRRARREAGSLAAE